MLRTHVSLTNNKEEDIKNIDRRGKRDVTGVPKRGNAFYTGNRRTLLSHKKLGCYSIESDRFPLLSVNLTGWVSLQGCHCRFLPPLSVNNTGRIVSTRVRMCLESGIIPFPQICSIPVKIRIRLVDKHCGK